MLYKKKIKKNKQKTKTKKTKTKKKTITKINKENIKNYSKKKPLHQLDPFEILWLKLI